MTYSSLMSTYYIHMYEWSTKVQTLTTLQFNYRIAGNFRGSKLSRFRPKNHFRGINFREFYYSAILYRIIYNFREFYFRESQKIAKRAKVIGLESFRLYGMLLTSLLLRRCGSLCAFNMSFTCALRHLSLNFLEFKEIITNCWSLLASCKCLSTLEVK